MFVVSITSFAFSMTWLFLTIQKPVLCRAKACSRYEVGAGHLPYLNLAKLRLSESPMLGGDGLVMDKSLHDNPSKEALLEICAALIRAPGGN